MQQFISRLMARCLNKREADKRREDFDEIYDLYSVLMVPSSRRRAASNAASRTAKCTARCKTTSPIGSSLATEGTPARSLRSHRKRPTRSPKSAGASAHRTACAKDPACLEQSQATAPCPSVPLRNTSPTPHGKDGWVKAPVARDRARACPSASSVVALRAWRRLIDFCALRAIRCPRLRPLRPHGRPADLWHPQL